MTALAPDTPVIFLMGATATGKTALSLLLARKLDAEIISVDSALVYRGMDIGTAKPDASEMQGIPHHLINVCDPWQSYSVARFCSDAITCIGQIHARGKRVLLVGGTMLYFKALEEGLAELPDADPLIRKALVLQAQEHGWQALHDELRAVDPQAALRIHPNDPQRLQRALEVYKLTGVALSELQRRTHSQLIAQPWKFALMPHDRAWLHRRIECRFQQMLTLGFESEMQVLYHDERVLASHPSMRSVGYRQAWEHLDAIAANPTMQSDDMTNGWVAKATAATRQLAKRQLTWLRSMSDVKHIQCDILSVEQQFDILVEDLKQLEKFQ